ncbi:AraC family transcriptional regulator [Weeksellaceae bacterium TAE3-ERU29]|nr:AraC family transcriptional regulator [Weeksellaceae bacterium TAE3-ERU29]
MGKFYNIQEEDLKELTIDTRSIVQSYKDNTKVEQKYGKGLGNLNITTEKKGNIYTFEADMNFNKDIKLLEESFPLVALCFNSGKSFYQNLNVKDEVHHEFKNNHWGLFFINNDQKGEGVYRKNAPVNFLSYNFLPDFFTQLVNLYPEMLESSYKRFQKGESFTLTDETKPINNEISYVLAQLQHAHLMGNSSAMYTEAKIIELLALQFDFVSQKSLKKTESSLKTNSDYHKIHEARHILLSDIGNPPSIKELSLQVGINEDKLKKGFKEVFGTTVFGYLYQHKMYLAKQYLLDSSLLINEIALLCGYDYVSHFSTAFKRFWGCTPGEMRG